MLVGFFGDLSRACCMRPTPSSKTSRLLRGELAERLGEAGRDEDGHYSSALRMSDNTFAAARVARGALYTTNYGFFFFAFFSIRSFGFNVVCGASVASIGRFRLSNTGGPRSALAGLALNLSKPPPYLSARLLAAFLDCSLTLPKIRTKVEPPLYPPFPTSHPQHLHHLIPRWLITFTAIRPLFGFAKGREVVRLSESQASSSMSAFSVERSAL